MDDKEKTVGAILKEARLAKGIPWLMPKRLPVSAAVICRL